MPFIYENRHVIYCDHTFTCIFTCLFKIDELANQKVIYATRERVLHPFQPPSNPSTPPHRISHLFTLPPPTPRSRFQKIMNTADNTAVQSPPTSPPAKRVKTDSTTSTSTAPKMAAENGNGVAVPLLEQSPPLLIKKLSDKARAPTRGSAFAAGYDIYAAKETVIPARGKGLVDTDISMAVPAGTCKLPLLALSHDVLSADHGNLQQTAASPPALASPPSTSSTRARASLTPTTAARSRCCCSTTQTPTSPSRRATASRSWSWSASTPRRSSRWPSSRRACAAPAALAALARPRQTSSAA